LLAQLENVPETIREKIRESEFNTVEKIAVADVDELKKITGDDGALAQQIIESAGEYLEGLKEMQAELEERQQKKKQPSPYKK
ncbi:MAG: helix-hairpin-helix domain-containing protein, partial [Candidatus Sumerlaeia bacterium]|nr:helix-hairpin-helix domain-containing protein [Candidatus Sumerlaeia bacterium]